MSLGGRDVVVRVARRRLPCSYGWILISDFMHAMHARVKVRSRSHVGACMYCKSSCLQALPRVVVLLRAMFVKLSRCLSVRRRVWLRVMSTQCS